MSARGHATGDRKRIGMGLSCCRRRAKVRRNNPAVAIRQTGETAPALLTQKRMLKTKLKLRRRTRTGRKDRPQMLHGLQQRLGLPAHRRRLLPAKSRAHLIQPALQSVPQPIDRFQGERQAHFFNGSLDRKPGQQFQEPPPHQRSVQRVTRQNLRQHQRKCFATAATLPAIGTKHPLAADELAAGFNGIITPKNAVPVQRLDPAAAGTALLFERKSVSFSAGSSRTNGKILFGVESSGAG